MRATTRLAGFAGLLVLVFGVAAVAGGAIGPERDGESAAARDSMSTHGTEETAADPVRGLAISDNGLRLALQQAELQRGRPTELRFRIVDARRSPVRDFDVEHEQAHAPDRRAPRLAGASSTCIPSRRRRRLAVPA